MGRGIAGDLQGTYLGIREGGNVEGAEGRRSNYH